MIVKLVLLYILLGMFVRDAHSEYETMKKFEIHNLHLNKSANTAGSHPTKQLICKSDDSLCYRYELESVLVENAEYPTGVNWTFKGLENILPKFIKIEILTVKCEHVNGTTEWESDVIIKDSCSFSYALKLITVRLSTIRRLTLQRDQTTAGRNPIKQLICVEGCDIANVSTVTCSKGIFRITSQLDLTQTTWSCRDAALPSFVNVVEVLISCDRVGGPFDDEVVIDSCGLKYRLRVKTEKLATVRSLFLQKNRYTIGFKPLQQLNCVGDKILCALYAPSTVICKNLDNGFNGNIRWKCNAQLGINIRFDDVNVSCENPPDFKYVDDVIVGSCSLRYSLIKTNGSYDDWTKEDDRTKRDDSFIIIVGVIVAITVTVLAVVIAIVTKCNSKDGTASPAQTASSHNTNTQFSGTRNSYPLNIHKVLPTTCSNPFRTVTSYNATPCNNYVDTGATELSATSCSNHNDGGNDFTSGIAHTSFR